MGDAGDVGNIFTPRISPDEKSVVFFQGDWMSFDIWLFDSERGNTTRFTSGPGTSYHPLWSPDSSRIAYAASLLRRNSHAKRTLN
jgi:Tol biopolymer transport system component